MMQACASTAKLRGGGPILNCGDKPHVPSRDATASDRHRQTLEGTAKLVVSVVLLFCWPRHDTGRKTTP